MHIQISCIRVFNASNAIELPLKGQDRACEPQE